MEELKKELMNLRENQESKVLMKKKKPSRMHLEKNISEDFVRGWKIR